MKYQMLSIRDTKADYYNQVITMKTIDEAVRALGELVTDQRSMIARHPEDYDLYHLGQFDDQTGELIPLSSPVHVMKAAHHPALKMGLKAVPTSGEAFPN